MESQILKHLIFWYWGSSYEGNLEWIIDRENIGRKVVQNKDEACYFFFVSFPFYKEQKLQLPLIIMQGWAASEKLKLNTWKSPWSTLDG